MPRYSVLVEWQYTCTEITTVEVSARDEDEALEKAEKRVARSPEKCKWEETGEIIHAEYLAQCVEVIE